MRRSKYSSSALLKCTVGPRSSRNTLHCSILSLSPVWTKYELCLEQSELLFVWSEVSGHSGVGQEFPVSEELLPVLGHEPAQPDGWPQLAPVQQVPGVHVVGRGQLQVQREHGARGGVLSRVGGVVITSERRIFIIIYIIFYI